MKKRYSFLFILLVLAGAASAQTSVLDNTTHWVSYSQTELYSGQAIADTALVSINKTSMSVDYDGKEKTFTVENVTGSWQDINEPGQIFFDIPALNYTGKGTLKKSASGQVTLTLDFSARKDGLKRTFTLIAQQ